MSKKTVKMYLHQDKESNWDLGEELGMDENTIRDSFAYTLSEVELDVEVDLETGETEIKAVDGVTLGSELEDYVKTFAYENKITCGEDIWQGTVTEEDAQDFLEKCLKLSGSINENA